MSVVDIIIRIAMAIIIGGFIGYEREMRNRPAGLITHTLVCVGATVVALMQKQMIYETLDLIQTYPELAGVMSADLGRVVAQVVTGVGFLGAGTIIFDKGSVKGLTTASTIWVVACIGLTIGLGYYKIAIISGISVIFIVVVLKNVEKNVKRKQFMMILELEYFNNNATFIEEIVKFFVKNKVEVRDIRFLDSKKKETSRCRFILYFTLFGSREKVMEKLSKMDSVITMTRGLVK